MKKASRTPTLDTYMEISEPHPERPEVRRFIIPESRLIIWNQAAPDGKIDMLIRAGTRAK